MAGSREGGCGRSCVDALELFNAAAEPKDIWVVEEASHIDVHLLLKEEYERRILDFFEKHLRQ
jgi:fermentation-respiration switch protein FrsA (DUF1100 family)